MSYGVARDVLQQILRMIQGGLVGPHTHKANNGGPIQTDTTMQFRNALQPMFDSDSQILNRNFNADLWRGQRYFVRSSKPSTANIGDLAYDGTTLYVWTGIKWLSLAGGGLNALNLLVNGGLVGSQTGLNLIQGSNVTITGVNNLGQSRVDVTVTATAGGGTPHPLLDGNINNDTVAGTPVSGDLIVGNSSVQWQRLPVAGAPVGSYLLYNGTIGWSALTYPASAVSGVLLYTFAANDVGGLPIGSSNQILAVIAGMPSWTNPSFAKPFMMMGA